jgi:HAD superfamily hydrolase (TIGR01549 family)
LIRAVIFDLGHTLWDIGPDRGGLEAAYAAMRATLVQRTRRVDLPEAPMFQQAVRQILHDASETYFMNGERLDQPPSHVWIDRGCRAIGVALDEALLREITPPLFATEADSLICSDGTSQAIADLAARGYALGCVTNTLADTPAIREMLRRHEIESLMRSVVVSTDEGWRKPHRSLFEKSLRELDVSADEALFVGDSPLHDIGGAQAVGMRTALTRQYVTRPLADTDPQPDAIISHVDELPQVIERLQGRSD